MNILTIADKRPTQSIKEMISLRSVDLIMTLGDLEESEISELKEITDIPKIGVYGNHCFPGHMETLSIFNMHMHTWEFSGMTFGGFEGCVRYKNNPYAKMYSQEEVADMMSHFPYVDVFIAHSPPRGINDEADPAHIGFDAFRTYLEEKQPKHFFHGHTYPKADELITQFKNTQIHYVRGDAIVTI